MKEEDKATSKVLDATQRIKRLLDQQLAINQLTLLLGELKDLDSIYKKIHDAVSRFMDTNGFIVSTYDNSDQLIQARYAMLNGILLDVSKFPPIPLEEEGKGIQSSIIRNKKPFYIPNVSEVQRETKTSYIIDHGEKIIEGVPQPDKPDSVSSRLLVPMMFNGEVHGVMQVQSFKSDAYTQDDIDILSSLANVAALILQNAFYQNNLEMLVEERTKELQNTQEQLVCSEKLAVLGRLSGAVGHELRNPLGAIKNVSYFLNMVLEDSDPDVKESLEILEKEVNRSEKIITNILGFARPKPLVSRNTNLNDVIKEALTNIILPENIKLMSKLEESLPIIRADPDLLAQVFRNVILNAIQAMHEGGKLTIETNSAEQDWVSIFITDTGSGIPDDVLEKIFEPLFTTKAKGIGLGLSITKDIVEKHGGSVEIHSKVGKGTTFIIKLPVASKASHQQNV